MKLEKNNLLLIKKVFEAISSGSATAPAKQTTARTKSQKSYEEGDLRLLHKKAVDDDVDVYHLLQEASYIKDVEEFDVA